jgi:micrococcal nuclease
MSRKKWLKFLTTFILGLVALAWLRVDSAELPVDTVPDIQEEVVIEEPELAVTSTNALAIRAVDGDTIEVQLDGSVDKVKVRLLGVDTPESVDPRRPVECFGKEASKFTASLVDGKRIRLVADPKADEVDKYGRLLRNVILADGKDLNATLISEGYANAYLSFPLDKIRKAQLTVLEREAKEAQRGLWNPETCSE